MTIRLTTTSPAPFHGFGTEAELRAFADALPEGLFTTDLAGKVTYWNRAATRITGWSSEEALGRDCSMLAGDAVNGCFCGTGPIRCGLLELGHTSKTCSLRTKDGRLLCIVKNATPLLDPDGSPVGALESFTAVGTAGIEPRCDWPAVRGRPGTRDLVGNHPAMTELLRTVALVAQTEATVMIQGESGVGKEVVAEAIHRGSRRSTGPWVRISCAALDEELLESELFGLAKDDRRGSFQEAEGGTLLLDEVGDLPPRLQAKLLRVVERREIERAGDLKPMRIDVRILCTSHRDLDPLVEAGRFRADLYFRLATFPLRVPPLRERREDVRLLVDALFDRMAGAGRPRPAGVSKEALAALEAHRWPGNVRELQNVLELAALRAGAGILELAHLPEELRRPAPSPRGPPGSAIAARRGSRAGALPAEEILAALERSGGNRAEAARRLGISRVTLWKRLKALEVGGGDG
jgi:transcriptional regulator with PAS, ATPase and Fis domain